VVDVDVIVDFRAIPGCVLSGDRETTPPPPPPPAFFIISDKTIFL
jgi:hypothetical protein